MSLPGRLAESLSGGTVKGKTIFALKFLVEGDEKGGKGIFLSLIVEEKDALNVFNRA
ncbi:hypothetical protein BR63_08750 [Thermanaerosceptrum fracticalcis]|uniref:KaiC-like domain-containing protein n=1 Tax=Thermanaerosceptrum fracticalcis TaxID=1712410 RepID=A0A7G6E2U2_THEFR|nr:ATPase domain-containing protein [Thermanaerosceptrum fracticalcis]QNB46396.1 hypothetical protein BR63_08750 [Thermanaerosceptrum fracticalcis]